MFWKNVSIAGAFLMLAPLFLSIGLPVEGIGILIAVDAIPDLFATVLNASGYLASTVVVAAAEGGGLSGPVRVDMAPPSRACPSSLAHRSAATLALRRGRWPGSMRRTSHPNHRAQQT